MWKKGVPGSRNIKPKKWSCEQCSRMRTSKEESVAGVQWTNWGTFKMEIIEAGVAGLWT